MRQRPWYSLFAVMLLQNGKPEISPNPNLRYGIKTAGTKGVASQNPLSCHHKALQYAITLDRFMCILRTCWMEATCRHEDW